MGNENEKKIRELLSSAIQNTPLKNHKKHIKIILLLNWIVIVGFMAQTTYTLRGISEEIKDTKQLTGNIQSPPACLCNTKKDSAFNNRYL